MNLTEAYAALDLSSDASPEDVKKKFKEAAKKYHPDVNKDPGAEDKFKKINEAYQRIQAGDSQPEHSAYYDNPFEGFPFGGFGNPFGGGRARQVQIEHIRLSTTISFKDSVFGCKKELKFTRNSKCAECNGNGQIAVNNGCTNCNGKGQTVVKNGISVFIQTCSKCHGRTSTTPCTKCSNGGIKSDVTVNVNIPGGIQNGNILRLQGMGNYIGNFGMFDQSSDVHLEIIVVQEPGLSIKNNDVVSFLEVSLLEAIQGCTKDVKTVEGVKSIDIAPLSRHRDEINIPRLGVNRVGSHKVILDVLYPKDQFKLINLLKDCEN